MQIKSIYYRKYEEDMSEIEQSSIDIFVKVDTGYTYSVTLAIPQYIDSYMEQQNINYFEPGKPFIMVKKLTQEIIAETIKAYAQEEEYVSFKEDGYFLKFYHFGQRIPETVFNQLQAEDKAQKESYKALEELYGSNDYDYPLYGGYESYQLDAKDEELYTYIEF
jgi:hypothetical protein